MAGMSVVCGRAARGDYKGALAQLGAMPPVPPAATVVRDALNVVLGSLVKCDHALTGDVCAKCGWRPPGDEEDQDNDGSLEAAQATAAAADR